jgi:hypothetical protein
MKQNPSISRGPMERIPSMSCRRKMVTWEREESARKERERREAMQREERAAALIALRMSTACGQLLSLPVELLFHVLRFTLAPHRSFHDVTCLARHIRAMFGSSRVTIAVSFAFDTHTGTPWTRARWLAYARAAAGLHREVRVRNAVDFDRLQAMELPMAQLCLAMNVVKRCVDASAHAIERPSSENGVHGLFDQSHATIGSLQGRQIEMQTEQGASFVTRVTSASFATGTVTVATLLRISPHRLSCDDALRRLVPFSCMSVSDLEGVTAAALRSELRQRKKRVHSQLKKRELAVMLYAELQRERAHVVRDDSRQPLYECVDRLKRLNEKDQFGVVLPPCRPVGSDTNAFFTFLDAWRDAVSRW